MAETDYVKMLRESLEKKAEVLQRIQEENVRQSDILTDPNSTPDELDANMNEKDRLVSRILQLDDGFEQLFERVKDSLDADRSLYADEIRRMQDLIRKITGLSAEVQAQEQKNKKLAQAKFSSVRQQVQKVRKSQKAVSSYYRNMMKTTYEEPQFLDNKK